MAIAFGSASGATTDAISVSVSYPGTFAAGDLLLLVAVAKYSAYTSAPPTGFTLLRERVGGSGGTGIDAGNVRVAVWYRIATGTETGTVSVTKATETGTAMYAQMYAYTRSAGYGWALQSTDGNSNTGAASWSAAGANNIYVASGDVVVAVSGVNMNPVTFASQSVTATGATLSLTAERVDSGTNNGHDLALFVTEHACTSGASTTAPSITATASGGTPDGPTIFIRLREALGVEAVQGGYDLNGQDATFLRALQFPVDAGYYAQTGYQAVFGTGVSTARTWFSEAWYSGAWSSASWYAPIPGDTPMLAPQISYALQGQDAALKAGRLVPADYDSYALSGQDATLYKGYGLQAEQGAYAASAAASVARTYVLAAGQGSHTLTPQNVIHYLGAQVGRAWVAGAWYANAWEGTVWADNAGAPNAYILTAQTGYYSTASTGGKAWFESAWYPGAWGDGVWTSGQIITNLQVGHRIAAETGYYTYTGDDALRDILTVPESGSYALTGQDIGGAPGLYMAAEVGAYGLTGYETTLLRGLRMTAQFGGYSSSGSDAEFVVGVGEYATTGYYALTGYPATFSISRGIEATQGSYTLNGQDVRMVQGGVMDAFAGTYALTGQEVTFARTYVLHASPGYYELGGQLSSPVTTTTQPTAASGGWWVGPRKRTKKELEDERIKFGVLPKPVQKAVRRAAKKVVDGVDSKAEAADLLARIARGERVSEPAVRAEVKRIQQRWNEKYAKVADAVVADSLLTRDAEEVAELQEIAEIFFEM